MTWSVFRSTQVGFCRNCERGFTGFCLTTNPGNVGAAYGYAGMGPYQGGQAEYLRVPYADFNCLARLPPNASKKKPTMSCWRIFSLLAIMRPSWRTSGRANRWL